MEDQTIELQSESFDPAPVLRSNQLIARQLRWLSLDRVEFSLDCVFHAPLRFLFEFRFTKQAIAP
jgi:hypothetical protein